MSSSQNSGNFHSTHIKGSNDSIKTVRKPRRQTTSHVQRNLNKINKKQKSSYLYFSPSSQNKTSDYDLSFLGEKKSISFRTPSNYFRNKEIQHYSMTGMNRTQRRIIDNKRKRGNFGAKAGSEGHILNVSRNRKFVNEEQISVDFKGRGSNSGGMIEDRGKLKLSKDKFFENESRIEKIKQELVELKRDFKKNYTKKFKIDKLEILSKKKRKGKGEKKKKFLSRKKIGLKKNFKKEIQEDEPELRYPVSDRTHYRRKNLITSLNYHHEPIQEEDENNYSSSSEDYYLKIDSKEAYTESQDFIDLNRYKNEESELEISKNSKVEEESEPEVNERERSLTIQERLKKSKIDMKRKSVGKVITRNSILHSKDRKKTLEEVLQLSKSKRRRKSLKTPNKKKKIDMRSLRLNLDILVNQERSPSSGVKSRGFHSAREARSKAKHGNIVGIESVLKDRAAQTSRVTTSFVEFKKKYNLGGLKKRVQVNHERNIKRKKKFQSFGENFLKKMRKKISNNYHKPRAIKSSRGGSKIKNLELLLKKNRYSLMDFEIIGEVKKLNYGEMLKAFNKKTKNIIILKKISKFVIKMLDRADYLDKETEIHSSLSNPFIARYLGKFSTKQYIYHMIDDFEQETLAMEIKKEREYKQNENYVKSVIKAILTATDYIHKRGIVHRDLNPSIIHISKVNF